MSSLSTPKLVLRRIRNAKMLLASIFLGILFATTSGRTCTYELTLNSQARPETD